MASMASLRDNFSGSTLNTGLWSDSGISGTVTIGGNTCTISLPIETGGTGYYSWIVANNTYDITNSYALAELVSTTSTVTDFYTGMYLSYNYATTQQAYSLAWEVDDAATPTIQAIYNDNYSYTQVYEANYSTTNHKWLMIDNMTSGTIRWSYSANGVNWTSAGTVATSTISGYITISALTPQLLCGTDTNLATASNSVWANFNRQIPPPIVAGQAIATASQW